jgi:DNA-binding response OmpR family regulator
MNNNSQRKILVVEDDRDFLLGLAVRLKASGYQVTAATDALTAVSVALKENPDLIILDLGLPAGDGFTVINRFSSLVKLVGIPVIVLTARDPVRNRERALQAGVSAFFQKPVDNDELLAAIRKALAESSTAPDQSSLPTKGSFRDIALPDLLQLFSASRNSCVVIIRTASRTGKVYLRAGQVYNAATEGHFWPYPQEALFEILSWPDGTFEIGPPDTGGVPTAISESMTALLLEGMRRLDEVGVNS